MDKSSANSTNEGRLSFTQILPLKELCYGKVAFRLCQHGFSQVEKWNLIAKPNRCYDGNYWRYLNSFKLQETLLESSLWALRGTNDKESLYTFVVKSLLHRLDIPDTIRLVLKEHVCAVILKVEEWGCDQLSKIFYQSKSDKSVFSLLDEIVWRSDGDIDYRETAIKMLSSKNINEVERFRIMAQYCLEDYSQELLPLKCENEIAADRDPMTNYWYRKLKADPSVSSNLVPEEIATDNVHGILYFWDSLDHERQLSLAISLVRKHNAPYQRCLLSGMTRSQQYSVLLEVGCQIVPDFAIEPYYQKFALSMWLCIRNAIPSSQFAGMIIAILSKECGQLDFPNFLYDMWRTAPDHLKRDCLVINNNRKLISHLVNGEVKNFQFLVEILLPAMDPNHRLELPNRILTTSWRWSAQTFFEQRPLLLNEFLKMCFSNVAAQVKFRNKWIKDIESHCLNLIVKNKQRECDKFIAHLLPEVTDVKKYKIELLQSKRGLYICAEEIHYNIMWGNRKLKTFVKMLDDVFANSDAALNFQKTVLRMKAMFYFFIHWSSHNHLDWVRELFERFLPHKKDRKTLKKEIISSSFTDMYILSHAIHRLSKSQWEEFLSWFLEDKESLMMFESSLIRDIFLNMRLQT